MSMVYRHHKKFQCEAISLAYDFAGRSGTAIFAKDNCCDMQGAIDVFTAIDPEVIQITTYAGNERDTQYTKRNGQWYSV